jgi:predicted unusual protein kinase regulating ubiquinone biosynthesis (AarF/ABC1/UbiB family)
MKLGQMISLDAGRPVAARADRHPRRPARAATTCRPAQLEQVILREWGQGLALPASAVRRDPDRRRLDRVRFTAPPPRRRELAIKFQYPGVRESIDSDVDNVSTLLRLSGLLPRGLDVSPLLAEAKRQLHEEADYRREGEQMQLFGRLLADSPDLLVPELLPNSHRTACSS